jgi:hypothetical protein
MDERGGGPISMWIGFSVFLVMLLFAVQVLFNLYATSVVPFQSNCTQRS